MREHAQIDEAKDDDKDDEELDHEAESDGNEDDNNHSENDDGDEAPGDDIQVMMGQLSRSPSRLERRLSANILAMTDSIDVDDDESTGGTGGL